MFFLAETPIFIVFSAKMQILKKHKKEKDTICEHNCANCSCLSVLFSAFFIFPVFFFQFPFFVEDVFLDWFPKIKKNTKKSKQNQKQEEKEGKLCKAKTNETL